MEIYIATNNTHKAEELKTLINKAGLPVTVRFTQDIGGMPAVKEDSDTFEDNARLKAKALQALAPEDAWILADDSGLCVDELNGAPGIHSARYAGEKATDDQNNNKLLVEMNEVPVDKRCARYVCCLILIHPSVSEVAFHSVCKGTILDAPEGEYGFGYDPLFMPLSESKTFSEMSLEAKNKISHRAQALNQLIDWLKRHISVQN